MNNSEQEVAVIEQHTETLPAFHTAETSAIQLQPDGTLNILDRNTFETVQRVSKLFASSTFVPDTFKNNVSNCSIAIMMAHSLDVNPFVFMQNSYVVNGKAAIEAKLVKSLMDSRGGFKTGVRFEEGGEGDERFCTAYVIRQDDSRAQFTVTLAQANASGWTEKNKTWKNIPELMLRYRATTYLCRTECPHLLMGMQTKEEVIDVEGASLVVEPNARALPKNLRAQKNAEVSDLKLDGSDIA